MAHSDKFRNFASNMALSACDWHDLWFFMCEKIVDQYKIHLWLRFLKKLPSPIMRMADLVRLR